MHGDRTNIIDENKEGIYPCIGYLGILLAGKCLSIYLHQNFQQKG